MRTDTQNEALCTTLGTAADTAVWGAKAANLARLLAIGINVPGGYVICISGCNDHLRRLGLPEPDVLINQLVRLPHAQWRSEAAAIRTRIMGSPCSPMLEQQVLKYHANLGGCKFFAIRSSAVGEDGTSGSFAGLFDTRLEVQSQDALIRSVQSVWASLFNDRVIVYSQQRGHRPVSMAVIVQRLIKSFVSGILFTRDPLSNNCDFMIIECCSGLGERLVSGATTPTRYRISKSSGAIDSEFLGEDNTRLAPQQLKNLIDIGYRIENQFGTPQDIEWSLTVEGEFFVLQSRPITTGMKTRAEILWSNANIAENYPGAISPFLHSFVVSGYAEYFRGLGRIFGFSSDRLLAMQSELNDLVGVHAGYLYYNLTNINAVLSMAPGGAWLARWFCAFTGAQALPQSGMHSQSVPAGIMELMRIAIKVPMVYLGIQRRVGRFETVIDNFAAQTKPDAVKNLSEATLAGLIRDFLTIRLARWTDAALADAAAMVCYGVLKGLHGRWLGQVAHVPSENNLLKGLSGLASAVPVTRLWTLSREVRADEALCDLFRDHTAEALADVLSRPEHNWFHHALEEYLVTWGFRYSGELMLTRTTPQENPLPVIHLLQQFVLQNGPGPSETSAEQARVRKRQSQFIEQILTPSSVVRLWPFSRAGVFRIVLRLTHGAIRLRERARMKQALLYTRLRHVALALGDHFVEHGLLEQANDIFFLTTDEAISLAEGGMTPVKPVSELVAARRLHLESCRKTALPDSLSLTRGEHLEPGADTIGQIHEARNTGPAGPAQHILYGTAACGGQAAGRATVVLDVEDVDRVVPGQILVTRQTDPGWAAVFFLIKGLVIERGGMLSHGAIIAREYGIPAVVGIPNVTRLIADGEFLNVNGDLGRVELGVTRDK